MITTVHPSSVSGSLRANPSKSYTQRAYALAALAHTPSVIHFPSPSDDGLAALGVARNLGARVTEEQNAVKIIPAAGPVSHQWELGESGLSFRMFSAIAALRHEEVTLKRSGSLKSRPTGFIIETLRSMGVRADVDDASGYLHIQGPLAGGSYSIDGSLSSQLITGLLIALPIASGSSVLSVSNLTSTPYVLMTLDMIRRFGGMLTHDWSDNTFRIPGGQMYTGRDLTIEGDWSGIAFLLVAGAIAGAVTVKGAVLDSLQGDKAIVEVVRDAGAIVEAGETEVTVRKAALSAFTFDATDCPDLFPPLAVLAACCDGVSRISGISRLTHKESDRFQAIREELGQLGVAVSAEEDTMCIRGNQGIHGATAGAHGDHRIAMMLGCAALRADAPVTINGSECVSKSYPGFFDDLRELGASIV